MKWGALQWPTGLDAQRFLDEYWQRRPLLIRQAFPAIEAGIDANDVAGLAMEPEADSRLITGRHPDGHWQVEHGPLEEATLTGLPERDWTLLVCGLEHWWPPAADLLSAFRFLPDWRIDDLMVSVAGRGGSVGPHVDQYDVFLLQAGGHREWQLARDYPPGLLPDLPLAILAEFSAEQQWTLAPGDLLYLPAGVAHHGIAQDGECMTWSIGFRAPSAKEWLRQMVEPMLAASPDQPRYRDDTLSARAPARFGEQQSAALRELLRAVLDDPDQFHYLAAQALTSSDEDLGDDTAASEALPDTAFTLRRGLRRALIVADDGQQADIVGGDRHWRLPTALAQRLLDSPADRAPASVLQGGRALIRSESLSDWLCQPDWRGVIEDWVNLNLLEIVDD